MKKLALLLAIIMTLSPLTFAIAPVDVESVSENEVAEAAQETQGKDSAQLAATTTPGLYYYQDFEEYNVDEYLFGNTNSTLNNSIVSNELVTVLTNYIGDLNCMSGQIKMDSDGNKYLELKSGNGYYNSFGVSFSDGNLRGLNMAFNYKSGTGYDYFNPGWYKSGVPNNYNAGSKVSSETTEVSWNYYSFYATDTTNTIGIVNLSGAASTLAIDDIRVWCTADADTAVPFGKVTTATITFNKGTAAGNAVVEMPVFKPFNGAWGDNTGVVNVPGYTGESQSDYLQYDYVNLDECIPTGAPYGYKFAGWSASDGGKKIKDTEYTNYKITGNQTLYAIWEPRETVEITFANSSTNAPSTATLPEALTVSKWESAADNVDLSGKTASTEESFEFLGWSTTDNGEIIADLTAYQPTESITLFAVWKSSETPTGLYFYQDFEALPASTTNYYDAAAVSAWLSNVESPMDGVSVSLNSISGMNGFAARVLQDEDTGNKFLRIQTNDGQYLSFGAHFSDDKLRGFNMAFNYRYTGSWQSDFVKSHDTGDTYYSGWGVENVDTPTTWTYKAWKTDTLSNGLGLAVNNNTIYLDIDDIRVWCVNGADTTIPGAANMELTATVTFDPGELAQGADVTMPTFEHSWKDNKAIVNIPGRTDIAVDYHKYDYVNLETCIPTGAPFGYEFAGWSATDGGTKIKDIEYSNYKITGNQTLYAIWTEIVLPEEIITYTPNDGNKVGVADGTFTVAAVNEAQGYTSAQLLYANDTEILENYTQIAELNLSSGVAAYTFEGGKSFPKGATRIAVKFSAEGEEGYIAYYDIPEANRFNADEAPLFTFYAVSDLHVQSGYYEENRNAVAADILSNNPDFVVINGDLVNQGTTGCFTLLDAFLDEKFNSQGISAFISNGNHEFYLDAGNTDTVDSAALLNTFSKQMTVLEEMGYDINRTGDELWYSTIIDGAKFIFMSTPNLLGDGTNSRAVTQEQLAFLDAELAQGQKAGLPMFVITHVPLTGYTPGATTTVENTDEVVAILNKYSGVTVISGHTHSNLSYDEAYVKLPANEDTFTHINDGCAAFLKGSDGTLETSFTAGQIIEVYEDKVIFKARKFDAVNGSKYFGHGQYVWYFGELKKSANITRFENSTANAPAEAVMPQAAVTDTAVAVDLSVFATTKENYVFKGWSLEDNGEILAEYVPTGDGILYAVWGIPAVAKFENFEGYEVGQKVYLADLGFITPNAQLEDSAVNNHPAGVIVADENGSKVLKLSAKQYAGFDIGNRAKLSGKDHLQFDYKIASDNDSRAVVYSGEAYGGATAIAWLNSKSWKNTYVSADSSNARLGLVMDGVIMSDDETHGTNVGDDNNYEMYIDNVYYWYIPSEEISAELPDVELTFANSTTNAPVNIGDLPAAVSKTIYTAEASETFDLNNYSVSTTDGYVFKGWSTSDNGNVVSNYNTFKPVTNQKLYAVWASPEDYFKPENSEKGVRTKDPMGIRAVAQVDDSTRLVAEDTQMGFIVTRAVLLGDTLPENFTFDFNGNFVHGACYDKSIELDNLWYFYDGGDVTAFSAAFVGIPAKNYDDTLVFRAYRTFIYNGQSYTAYGDPVSTTVLEIANTILTSEKSSPTDKNYAQTLIDDYNYAKVDTSAILMSSEAKFLMDDEKFSHTHLGGVAGGWDVVKTYDAPVNESRPASLLSDTSDTDEAYFFANSL